MIKEEFGSLPGVKESLIKFFDTKVTYITNIHAFIQYNYSGAIIMNSKQIGLVRKQIKQGRRPRTISRKLCIPISDVLLIYRENESPVQKKKPVAPGTAIKIREEYKIMVDGGMKAKDAREELARWYILKDLTVYNIVKFNCYRNPN